MFENLTFIRPTKPGDPLIRLTIYLDGLVAQSIEGFSSVSEALEHGMEWKNRLGCSVFVDGVEAASECPRAKLNPSDPECTAYKHVIPKVVP